MIIHDSDLSIYKGVDLTPDYEYTIDFETSWERDDYFRTKLVESLSSGEYSHLNPTEYITVPYPFKDVEDVNYCRIQNAYERDIFCFITQVEYVSETTTRLYLKVDVMQTFMFSYELGECFVEREHQDRWRKLKDSTLLEPVFNLNDEGLAYGDEYDHDDKSLFNFTLDSGVPLLWVYAFVDPSEAGGVSASTIINGVDTGYAVIAYPIVLGDTPAFGDPKYLVRTLLTGDSEMFTIDSHLGGYQKNTFTRQMILSPFPPRAMRITQDNLNITIEQLEDDKSVYKYIQSKNTSKVGLFIRELKGLSAIDAGCQLKNYENPSLAAYTQNDKRNDLREVKLKQFPYSFRKIYYGGNELTIKNEYLKKAAFKASLRGFQSLSFNATSMVQMNFYNNTDIFAYRQGGINNSITNQVPLFIDLSTAAWQKYMLENKNQRISGFITQGVGLAASVGLGVAATVLTGGTAAIAAVGAIGQTVSTITSVSNQLAKESDIKSQPNDLRVFNGDMHLNVMMSLAGVVETEYSIQRDYSIRLGNYFNHYGYKALAFKTPDIKSRYYFNYIKCTDVSLKTDIASVYIDQIKDIYKKGITFWHYRGGQWKGVNNYEYENAEMSLLGG